MFRSAFVALVLASSVFAGPMKRSSGLTVDVAGPSGAVSDVNQLKFKATVKNTGSDDVKILKYGTVLDGGLPTRSFSVTKDGKDVSFTGVKLQVSLDKPNDSFFVSIPAGQSVTVEHDVADLFDFASAGTGTFRFEPVASFHVATGSNEKPGQFERVQVSSNAVEVNVTDQLKKREMVKRARDTCQVPAKRDFIDAAYVEGQALAANAVTYIGDNGADPLSAYHVVLYSFSPALQPRHIIMFPLSCKALMNDNCSCPFCKHTLERTIIRPGAPPHHLNPNLHVNWCALLSFSCTLPHYNLHLSDVSAASVNLNSLRAVQFSESPKHIFQPTRGAPEAPSLTFLPSHRRRVVSTITWADSEEVTMLIGSTDPAET
ncbi:neutral protease 2 [Moniliophthora roreri]|nr:neutral protease 2 [Moniliophthora roreri]